MKKVFFRMTRKLESMMNKGIETEHVFPGWEGFSPAVWWVR